MASCHQIRPMIFTIFSLQRSWSRSFPPWGVLRPGAGNIVAGRGGLGVGRWVDLWRNNVYYGGFWRHLVVLRSRLIVRLWCKLLRFIILLVFWWLLNLYPSVVCFFLNYSVELVSRVRTCVQMEILLGFHCILRVFTYFSFLTSILKLLVHCKETLSSSCVKDLAEIPRGLLEWGLW